GILFEGTAIEPSYLQGILVIAGATIVFTVFGGMTSVVIADNILTVIMVLAVLIIGTLTFMQPEIGGFTGLIKLDQAHANKMHLYLPSNHPDLPWTGIFTGLIILHFFYWTTNQYQVQRVLAAETERDAKLGSIVAGMLKFIIPFFSIAAGTAAFYLFNSRFGENAVLPDDTFITLLDTVVPVGYGLSGLILAGLICAIFSAIYSMMNSVSTMLAYDIYRNYINKNASDRQTVRFGQVGIIVMCALSTVLAYVTFDPESSENFFLILANQTSYIKPGLVVVFFWGILWKKTHPIAALTVLIASPLIGWGLDILYNHFLVNFDFVTSLFGTHFNFLHRVFMIFAVGSILLVVLSQYFNRTRGVVVTNELSVSFVGTRTAILRGAVIHAPLVLLVLLNVITPEVAAYPAAVLTFGLFLWYMKKENSSYRFYQSDIFYAGILTAALVWILYFFA